MSDVTPEQDGVVVFHAEDPELVPLAEAALEQASIPYAIRQAGTGVPAGFGGHAVDFGGAGGAADVVVHPSDAARARELLSDLERAVSTPAAAVPVMASAPRAALAGPAAYRLYDADSKATIGTVTAEQMRFLSDELEEESESDQDYYVDAATIDMLAEAGADAGLVAILKHAVGGREGIEIGWDKI